MATIKLLLAEVRFRKLSFLLSLLAVVAAATLFTAGPVLIDGYARQTDAQLRKMEDETRKLMRNMGFNLMIVHKDTDMGDFWASDFASQDMPESYIQRLAEAPELEHVRHLVATLQQRIKWRQRNVLLAGYQRETPQTHFKQKKPMGYNLKRGTLMLGFELWSAAEPKLSQGDKVEVLGQTLTIAKTLDEKGSKEDITIVMNLADAQQVLNKPGRVNQILALGCQCQGERLPTIRRELESVLPETKITEFRSIAQGRAEQRKMVADRRLGVQDTMENMATAVTPLVVIVCGLWVGLLALANVRHRRAEIGLLRALGKKSGLIAGLFLGRAALLGLLGGGLGFLLGSVIGRLVGVQAYEVHAGYFLPAYDVLLYSLLGAPLVCAVASYLPTMGAIAQDPAVVLRDG